MPIPNFFDVTRKSKTAKSVPTSPWMNNLYSTKDEQFNVNIPEIGTGPTGLPEVPSDAYNLDTAVPWRDKQYELSIEKILGAGGQQAAGLDRVIEKRGQDAENVIRDALAASSGPAMSQQDIDQTFAQDADRVGQGFNDDIASVRNYLGGSGITGGGYAAGLASQYQMARMGQITDARRSLQLEAAKMNTAKKMADFNNTLSLASIVNRDPAMVGMDWTQNILDLRMQQQGVEKQDRASREQAKAAKKAGNMAAIGQGLGIAGKLFGAI